MINKGKIPYEDPRVDHCPNCRSIDRLKPRWFNVPRNLFILNGRIRARGASGGSHRVYGWAVERLHYATMFARSNRHVDRIICPDDWHNLENLGDGKVQEVLPRKHKTAEERKVKALAKRQRSDKRN